MQCSVFCDQSAVAMRLSAGLARTKLTLLSRSGSTGWTKDFKCFFGAEFFLHGGEIMTQSWCTGMVNFEQFRAFFFVQGKPDPS